jgi:hypothetical protein
MSGWVLWLLRLSSTATKASVAGSLPAGCEACWTNCGLPAEWSQIAEPSLRAHDVNEGD